MREIIFKELELKNFKCHEELSFSFVPNRFVTIVGNNGTGKTTIFSALSWALYDQTIEGMSGDDVVRKRTGKNTSVILTWDDNEDHYEIQSYRKHFKHKNNRYLFKNGKDITGTSQKETLDKISQLVMPKDIFFNCLLFSQFVKNHFLDLTPSGRNEILDAMLLLNKFNDWFKKTGKLIDENQNNIKKIQESITVHETKIALFEKNIIEENVGLSSLIANFANSVDSRNKMKSDLNMELEQIIPFCSDLEKIKKKLLDLEKQKSSFESQLTSKEQNQSLELSQIEEQKKNKVLNLRNAVQTKLESETQEDFKQLDDLKQNKNQIVSEHSKLLVSLEESATKARQRDKDKRNEEISPIQEEIKQLKQDILSLESKIETCKNTVNSANKELEKLTHYLNQDVARCFACKQELRENSKEELIERSKKLSETIRVEQEKINNLQKTVDEKNIKTVDLDSTLQNINQKWNKSDEDLEIKINVKKAEVNSVYQNNISSIDSGIKTIIEKIQNKKDSSKQEVEEKVLIFEKEFLDLSKVIEEKNNQDLLKLKGQIQKLSIEIGKVEQQLIEKQENIDKRKEIENQLQYLEKLETSEEISIKNRENELKDKIRKIESELNSEKQSISVFLEQIEVLKRRDLILNFWRTGYSDTGIKAILLDDSIPVLNEKAKELCELASNLKIRFDSQTALKSGDYRNKFGIDVLQTQNLSGLKELSSGEKRMTDIIVLLCLRHLLEERQNTKMNILLLDEILDSLDPENAALAVAMVKKLSEDHCVSLISHTLRDYVDSDDTYTF